MQVKNISAGYNIKININFTVGWKLKKLSQYLIIITKDLSCMYQIHVHSFGDSLK